MNDCIQLCSDFEAEVAAIFADTHDFKIAFCQQNQQTAGRNKQVGQILWRFHTSVYAFLNSRLILLHFNSKPILTRNLPWNSTG
jgi:hypothetical protein